MEGKDNIKELFSQKLGSYEAPVNPELWAKISSQVAVGATTTAATTGLSVLAKVGIGLGISAAAITTIVLLSTSSDKEIIPSPSPKEMQQELPTTTTTNEKEPIAELTNENAQSDLSAPTANTPNDQRSPEANTAYVDPSQSTPPFKREIPLTIDMPTRGATTVTTGGKTTEPTIVEGVKQTKTTTYPATQASVEDPVQLEETTTPKVEPIKRYVNVFTPNGDGINDYFALESKGLIDFSVVVFNPAGDVVFQSSDSQFKWDGRDMRSGEMVDSGTYMYMVSSQDADGNPYPIYERLVIQH